MKKHLFKPKVSIIIPVYNGDNYLSETINSALSQTYKNTEIIIINDGSTDKSKEIALSHGNKIKYFEKENGGASSALNLGIEKMTGEYFSWLSHDDLYNKNKIKFQVEALRKISNKDTIIGCYQLLIDNDRNILKKLQTVDNKNNYHNQNALLYLLMGYVKACDLLISKNILLKYGAFNINLITTQDYDLLFKIFKYEKLLIIPKYLVYYRLHSEQNSKTQFNYHNMECSKLWIGFDSRISSNEKIAFFNSEEIFYKIIYYNIGHSAYDEAILFYKNKLIKSFIKNHCNIDTISLFYEYEKYYIKNLINGKNKIVKKILFSLYNYGFLYTINKIFLKVFFFIVNKLQKKV